MRSMAYKMQWRTATRGILRAAAEEKPKQAGHAYTPGNWNVSARHNYIPTVWTIGG